MPLSIISEAFFEYTSEMIEKYRHLLTIFRTELMNEGLILYAEAVQNYGGALPDCINTNFKYKRKCSSVLSL